MQSQSLYAVSYTHLDVYKRQVYDLNHFPVLREKYKVMSVPCLVLDNGRTVSFGKKNIPQILDLLPK